MKRKMKNEKMTVREMRDTLRAKGAIGDTVKMIALVHYLIFRTNVDFHVLVNAPQVPSLPPSTETNNSNQNNHHQTILVWKNRETTRRNWRRHKGCWTR